MFSRAPQRGQAGRSAAAYRQVGFETAVATASAHALTMMLFDALVGAVKQARFAIDNGAAQDKGRYIGKALSILNEGLRASLNLEQGGEIALNLRDLYDYAQLRLLQANLRGDGGALDEVASLIEPIRDAWAGIRDRLAVDDAGLAAGAVK